ncbi:hypothetical protein SUGI_0479420 [Cryptomeria japonica]|nr:hypothetical protein SUGI_0479420 [Cryptomeria japonica]
MMAAALTASHKIAAVVSVHVLVLWILFSGAMISRRRCPPCWRWFFSANLMAWCLYGLITSQYGDVGTSLKMADGTEMSVKHFVEKNFGYHRQHLASVGILMAGFSALFGLVFFLGIKLFNFQNR